MKELIERLFPNLEDYQKYEEEDVNRNISKIKKSQKFIEDQNKIQLIKERQIRVGIEEKKEQKNTRGRLMNSRRANEARRLAAVARQRTPLTDHNYRQK